MTVGSNLGCSNRYYVVIKALEFESIKVNKIAWYIQADYLPPPSVIVCGAADKTFDHQHARTNGLPPPNQRLPGLNHLNTATAVLKQSLLFES